MSLDNVREKMETLDNDYTEGRPYIAIGNKISILLLKVYSASAGTSHDRNFLALASLVSGSKSKPPETSSK